MASISIFIACGRFCICHRRRPLPGYITSIIVSPSHCPCHDYDECCFTMGVVAAYSDTDIYDATGTDTVAPVEVHHDFEP